MDDRLIVDMLAAARLTRLITTDSFPPVKIAREGLLDVVDPDRKRRPKGAEPPALADLLECNWCTGWYVSVGVLAARRWLPGWGWIARALATSMVVGFVATRSEHTRGDLADVADAVDKAGKQLAQVVVPFQGILRDLSGGPSGTWTETPAGWQLRSYEKPEVTDLGNLKES